MDSGKRPGPAAGKIGPAFGNASEKASGTAPEAIAAFRRAVEAGDLPACILAGGDALRALSDLSALTGRMCSVLARHGEELSPGLRAELSPIVDALSRISGDPS